MFEYVLYFLAGIFSVCWGAFRFKNPQKCWQLSKERLNTRGGSPSKYYISTTKISGIFIILFGIFAIVVSLYFLITGQY